MKKLKILLGDLRHTVSGKSIVVMPIGIGYITSYTQAKLGTENLDFSLFVDPDVMLKEIQNTNFDIIGLSNYCWNTELSRLVFKVAKETHPGVICIAGGPDFPLEYGIQQEYLRERSEIDFYAYREGEKAFASLVEKIMEGKDLIALRTKSNEGIASINPLTDALVVGAPSPRIKNLDDIPSPYLNGLMEQWFDGYYAPSLETTRGCPYTCSYCEAAQDWYTPLSSFSLGRIKEELAYIAQKMISYPTIHLAIHDSNFGMFKRDKEIAVAIRALQDKFDWPNVFEITTGRAQYDRVLEVSTILKDKLCVSTSVQSLNPDTLRVIKRKNPPLDKLLAIFAEIKRREMPTDSELILPLPLETKESFFASFRTLINARVDSITPFTTMLFRGADLGSKENREKFGMSSGFRLLPRQYGEYSGRKCFEVEEVCIATNTMSFEEYLECRGFSLIATTLSSEQFDIVSRHLRELDIEIYEFVVCVWELIKAKETKLSKLYTDYIEESRKELWDSAESLIEHYKIESNYKKLFLGEHGDNKIRKYKTKIILEQFEAMVELIYTTIRKMLGERSNKEIVESLVAAEKWIIATRKISDNINDKSVTKELYLPYDISTWYDAGINADPLIAYESSVYYRIYPDRTHIAQMMDDGRRLYGDDINFIIGKLLINLSVKSLWCKTELISKPPIPAD